MSSRAIRTGSAASSAKPRCWPRSTNPNIAAIYDLQEAENSRFLVLELVEGETLAERIRRGPLPVDEALHIAKSICDAVEAAHEKGVVHRDLKPANVKITPEGAVKVLDFGLAKIHAPSSAASPEVSSQSPTLLSMAATNAGIIIGTAAYMSPEQARGREAGHRSDVFAIGCILYEMLTGRQAFQGEEVSDILASVLAREPDFAALPANVSARVRELLRRCLEKNPKRRWHAVGDLRIEIENALAGPAGEPAQTAAPRVVIGNTALAAVAASVSFALAVTLFLWAPWRTAPAAAPAVPLRMSGELGTDASLAANLPAGNSALALSPDGSVLAFVARKGGNIQIYIRRLGQLEASPLSGTSGAQSPFFSPDGQWLGFFADNKLKKISVTGGAAVTLCDAPNPRGGSWGDDGFIAFTLISTAVSMQRVPAAGGKVETLAKFADGEVAQRRPWQMPGGKGVLYSSATTVGAYDDANIVVQPLPSGTPKVLIRGGYHAAYVPSGHLVYIHEGTLFAAPFDLNRLEVTGQSVPVVEGVSAQPGNPAAQFAVSQSGVLAYLPGTSAGVGAPVVWMSHDGKTAPLRPMPSNWNNLHFSPDGRRLAFDIQDPSNLDVWVYEWARDTLSRLTFDPAGDQRPVWMPDSSRIAFASQRAKGPFNLYWQRADGTGDVQRLTESSNAQFPASFHPSGKYLVFGENTPQNFVDLMILPIEGDEKSGWKPGKPSVFLSTPANETEPMFSPDGRWIAYQSNESGRANVFVRPFPGPGGKWQIGEGTRAAWSRTRRELLYVAPDSRIMVASYTVEGDSFRADKPRLWSEQPILRNQFDLHPDGDRIAAAVPSGQAEEKLDKVTFIFNFFDELRRIAPPAKK
jgi:Tol biopolymer transport system component